MHKEEHQEPCLDFIERSFGLVAAFNQATRTLLLAASGLQGT